MHMFIFLKILGLEVIESIYLKEKEMQQDDERVIGNNLLLSPIKFRKSCGRRAVTGTESTPKQRKRSLATRKHLLMF